MARKSFTTYIFGWLAIFAVLLVKSPVQPLRNIFDYKGRATVREFWLFFIFWVNLIPFILGYYIAGFLGIGLSIMFVFVIEIIKNFINEDRNNIDKVKSLICAKH